MAERDQPVQIFVGALDRHPAHRNVGPEMLAAFGQHDAERARGDFGVGEEQFVEVAHPVEQQAIRIGGLDLDVLLHHWCNAADFVGRYGRHARRLVAGFGGRLRSFSRDGARSVHIATLKRNDFKLNHYFALAFCLSMIFSENRYPLFRIML
jgi:hypothetical protein